MLLLISVSIASLTDGQGKSLNSYMETQRKSTSEKKELTTVEELDPRWANFVDLYLTNGNAKRSAIEAGFSENYADVITSRFPEKVRKSLVDALDHKGITSDK